MAVGFARAYGSDVLTAESAGLAPAMIVASLTRKVMLEKNIDLGEDFPKTLDMVTLDGVDLIINMSGYPLPMKTDTRVEDWNVRDPIGESEDVYREVRDQIEQRVMRMILELRSRKSAVAEAAVDTRRRRSRQ
jgi:arsenate reductase (thioredoxin)